MSSAGLHRADEASRLGASFKSTILTLITLGLYSAVFALVAISVAHDVQNGETPGASLFDGR